MLHCCVCVCTGNRMTGLTIRIGTDDVIDDNAVCGTITSAHQAAAIRSTNEKKIIVECGTNLAGRYVSVHIPSVQLQLCEIKVICGDTCAE